MKKLSSLVAVAALAVLLSSCSAERPGNPVVFEEIKAETDCVKLIEDFNRNHEAHGVNLDQGNIEMAKVNTEYMKATDERIRELECPLGN